MSMTMDEVMDAIRTLTKTMQEELALLEAMRDDKPPEPIPAQVPGYKVVDFRPPLKGEKFWVKGRLGNGAISNYADWNEPPNEPRYILAKIAPENREMKYEIERGRRQAYCFWPNIELPGIFITEAPSMVGFKHFIYADGHSRMTPVYRANAESPTEVAKFAVFEETT